MAMLTAILTAMRTAMLNMADEGGTYGT